jgi:hypothetical protein
MSGVRGALEAILRMYARGPPSGARVRGSANLKSIAGGSL